MSTEPFAVEIQNGERVSAVHYLAKEDRHSRTVIILAHGAGAGQRSDFMLRFAQGLAERGIDVITFNFPYMESGRRVPDSGEKLESCYRAVILQIRKKLPQSNLIIGGKSMGGRIASQLAAKDTEVREMLSGLVFLGYPLHPPGKPDQRRDRHLPNISLPMLFIQGSRDAFGTPEELQPVLRAAQPLAKLSPVDGADHSLKIPKRSEVSQEDLYFQLMNRIVDWASELESRSC